MKQEEIQNQIKKLEKEYADLKEALASLTSNFSNTSILRGILSGAGSAAELILKCVYRKEITLDEKIPAERAEEMKRQASEKLMLDELIKNVESKIPLRILTHLRTIQAWRNIGSHDKGEEINETVNSSSLQVVSLAVNELIIWFVSEYLNLDATNFIDNSAEENTIIRNSNADSIEAWKEAYWYAMKDGSISRLAQSKLDFLSKKLNLTEEDKNKVIASFERNETEFVELINEIFKNSAANNLDLEELEHVDFIRQECCISEKEASELLQQKTFNNKIIENKDKITFEWIRNLIPDKEQTDVVKELSIKSVIPEVKINLPENKIQEESSTVKKFKKPKVAIKKEEALFQQKQNLPTTYTNDFGMEFILVEAGTFMMGVSDVDYEEYLKDKGSDFLILAVFETSGVDYEEFLKDNDSDYESIYARAKEILPYAEAKPAHKVILTQSYYIGKYPVTQIQWERIMGNNPSEYKDRPNCPVETVSWNDCQKFISKLNQKSGKKYRLPTEAEWEFAARGGNKSRGYKFSGSDNIDEVAWCEDNSFEIKKVEKKSLWGLVKTYEDEMVFEGTRPVGTKKPNELGIYDMSGNVSEWCLDKIHEYCSDYQTNPLGTNDNDDCHVMRGGNWRWSSDDCLVSYRSYDNRAFSLIGFRLVLPVE